MSILGLLTSALKLTFSQISQLPESHWNAVPYSVSVVENECDRAKNNLLVTYNPLSDGVEEKKKKFAVCVKARLPDGKI